MELWVPTVRRYPFSARIKESVNNSLCAAHNLGAAIWRPLCRAASRLFRTHAAHERNAPTEGEDFSGSGMILASLHSISMTCLGPRHNGICLPTASGRDRVPLAGVCAMSPSLHELKNGAPAKCAHCGQPFRIKDQQVECWLQ